jgi:hypothetical protein
MNYTDIKSFEDACAAQGLDAATVLPDFSMFPERDRKAMEAHAKLIIINKALNGDWTPDWTNGKWDKYYPWFYMNDKESGSGFSYYGFVLGFSYSIFGSRLCYRSSEIAEYAGEQFLELYRDYFVIA